MRPRFETLMNLADPRSATCAAGGVPLDHGLHPGTAATVLAQSVGLVEVLALDEEVERQPDLLDFLEACGLVPGLWAEVVCQTSAGTRIVGARAHAVLPPSLAHQVLVRPIDPMAD